MPTSIDPHHATETSTIYVDGHVHVYERADCGPVLDAASRHFREIAARRGDRVDQGVLLLADPTHIDGFGWFSQLTTDDAWRVVDQPDDSTLHLQRDGHLPLMIVAGHQAISRENLEVLIFPPIELGESRRGVDELIELAHAAGGIAILPWGAGKWLGARGRRIDAVLEAFSPARLAVADNGGRSRIPRRVRRLDRARTTGFPVIDGTDPLPIAGDRERVGQLGVALSTTAEQPLDAAALLDGLMTDTLTPIGERVGPIRFVVNQLALRLRR